MAILKVWQCRVCVCARLPTMLEQWAHRPTNRAARRTEHVSACICAATSNARAAGAPAQHPSSEAHRTRECVQGRGYQHCLSSRPTGPPPKQRGHRTLHIGVGWCVSMCIYMQVDAFIIDLCLRIADVCGTCFCNINLFLCQPYKSMHIFKTIAYKGNGCMDAGIAI